MIAVISYCTILNIVIILVNLTAVDVNFDTSGFSLQRRQIIHSWHDGINVVDIGHQL